MITLIYVLVALVVAGTAFSFFSMGTLTRLANEKLSWEHRMVIALAVLVIGAQSWLVYATGNWSLLAIAIVMGSWLLGMSFGGMPSLRKAYKEMIARAEERRKRDRDMPEDDHSDK